MNKSNPRHLLTENMLQLASSGKSCASCSGTCCTFVANSMMVTHAEATALVENLQQKNLLTETLLSACQDSISRFALDRPTPGTGQRNLLRRNYTCPLFQHKSNGCPLDPDAKPFGCLAFNPTVAGETEGRHCGSDQQLLELSEELISSSVAPAALEFGKQTIPQAILALAGKLKNLQ